MFLPLLVQPKMKHLSLFIHVHVVYFGIFLTNMASEDFEYSL